MNKLPLPKLIRLPYALYTSLIASYNLVVRKGLFKSALKWSSIDAKGNPIPWFSYPAIDALNAMNLKNKSVFEWGSGNSTLYFYKHAKSIRSVEDNANWYSEISKTCPDVELITTKDAFVNAISGLYDVIVVDGSYRKECAIVAMKHLKKDGFIIADDTNTRADLKNVLDKSGLLPIHFIGAFPIGGLIETMTSFYFNK